MPAIPLTATSLVTIGACVLAVGAVVSALPPVIDAALSERPEAPDFDRRFEQLAEKHQVQSKVDRDRFEGRSLFFDAKAPKGWVDPRPKPKPRTAPPPTRVATDPVDVKPAEPAPPPVIAYTGPPIIGVDGGFVYFEKRGVTDGVRVGLGETDDSLGVTIKSFADAPARVKIEYRGKEFDLPLFAAADEELLFAGAKDLDGVTGSPETPFSSSARGNSRGRDAREAAARGRNRARTNGNNGRDR
ncbi:MAG: hypothetical protein AB8G96_12575 [Phycisphaerales bacterium]